MKFLKTFESYRLPNTFNDDGMMILNPRPNEEDIVFYLYWLWNSDYKYHIDDNVRHISIFPRDVMEVLERNSEIMWENFDSDLLWKYYSDENKDKSIKYLLNEEDVPWFLSYGGFKPLFIRLKDEEIKKMLIEKFPTEYDDYKTRENFAKYKI